MTTITFGIRDKKTNELLSRQNNHNTWMDGDYDMSETEYTIERDGYHGRWTTDCMLETLFIKEKLIKENTEEYPTLDDRGDFEVVALHSFGGMEVITTEGVLQTTDGLFNKDDILRARATRFLDTFHEQEHERLVALAKETPENPEHFNLNLSSALVIIEMIKERQSVVLPVFNKQLIINACESLIQQLK